MKTQVNWKLAIGLVAFGFLLWAAFEVYESVSDTVDGAEEDVQNALAGISDDFSSIGDSFSSLTSDLGAAWNGVKTAASTELSILPTLLGEL